MLSLIRAQVWKYKSIEDSTPVEIAESVTVLVGKNQMPGYPGNST